MFAEISAEFNPGTLGEIAGQGTHGVEVIVVAALAVIVCALFIFIFRFYRESRKYDLLRDEVLKELTDAVTKYTTASDQRFEKINDSLERIEDDLGDGIKALTEKVDDHEQRLGEVEQRLGEVEERLDDHESVIFSPAPAAKQKKRK